MPINESNNARCESSSDFPASLYFGMISVRCEEKNVKSTFHDTQGNNNHVYIFPGKMKEIFMKSYFLTGT
jgi:hypothetical protein